MPVRPSAGSKGDLKQSRKSKGDLLRDPLHLPICKTIQSLAYENSKAHGVGCINLAPFVADVVEDVFTRSKLIQFLNENRSVHGRRCAPDWRSCRKGNRRRRRMIN